VRRILVAAALAVAIGCGSKPAESERPEPRGAGPAAPVVEDRRPAIVALGDSITAGHGVGPGHSYPDYVQRALEAKGYRYRVINEGVSGDTTSNGLERLSQVIERKPEVVILELGGNDGLRGIPIESTRANLEEMIAALHNAGAVVVLAGMTLPPNYGVDYIRRFERMYEELASRHRLKLIAFRLEKLGGTYNELMQRDGLHPTREGHRRLGEYVARELETVLQR
jgi:acyl-CoA thioesterase-1